MSVSTPKGSVLEDRLGERTLALIDVPSVSRDEADVLASIRTALPPSLEVLDDHDAVLFATPAMRRAERPFVLLTGHVDTVPIAGNVPGRLDDGIVVGRGASDMKGALAVILELAAELEGDAGSFDVGVLFFGREELPFTESALRPLFERCPAATTPDLAHRDGADRQRDRGRMSRQPERHGHRDRTGGAQRASVARGERDPRVRSLRSRPSPICQCAT